jgi:hypothetical protein
MNAVNFRHRDYLVRNTALSEFSYQTARFDRAARPRPYRIFPFASAILMFDFPAEVGSEILPALATWVCGSFRYIYWLAGRVKADLLRASVLLFDHNKGLFGWVAIYGRMSG